MPGRARDGCGGSRRSPPWWEAETTAPAATAPSTTAPGDTGGGDGTVDFEIWANLGPEGWGAAYYDNTDRTGGFGDESNVTVVVREQTLELIFPDVLLDRAERFRFSLASEYGDLDVLGSDYARRDDAPDGGRAVAFPA